MGANDVVQTLKSNVYVRYVVILLVGITVGAVFYPSKNIKESISKQYEQQIQTLQQQHSSEIQSLQQTYQTSLSQEQSKTVEAQGKIDSLTTQVTELQSHKTTNYYKIVHPDGTVEIKQSTEDDTDSNSQIASQVQQEWQSKMDEQAKTLQTQYQQTISSMQQQMSSMTQTYQQTIATMQETKTVQDNPKKFGIEAGRMTNTDYYGHVTYDLWGPFEIGVHAEFGSTTNSAGAGIGFHF